MTYLMSLEPFPPLRVSSVSNRPFAHCIKFSESEISLFAFRSPEAREIFQLFLSAIKADKDIITNYFTFVKHFLFL